MDKEDVVRAVQKMEDYNLCLDNGKTSEKSSRQCFQVSRKHYMSHRVCGFQNT